MRILRAELIETRSLVKKEVQDYAKQNEGDKHGYFNNFHMHFPTIVGGKARDSYYRHIHEMFPQHWDIPRQDVQLANGLIGTFQYNSSLYLHLTPREFYRLLDWSVETSRVTMAQILEASERVDLAPNPGSIRQAVIGYGKLLYPAYITMRASGFNRHDLTG